jgi:hypothetical protein
MQQAAASSMGRNRLEAITSQFPHGVHTLLVLVVDCVRRLVNHRDREIGE